MSTSAFGRLTRVTDLFVEGSELDLGQDDTGTPVVVWVKKLNSFEDSEARKDGMAARAARILALKSEDSPDHINLLDQIERQGDDWLRDQVVDSTYEEDYLRAVDDVDSDPEWAPRLDELRRMDVILSEGGVPEGDPRWTELTKANEEYVVAIGKALQGRQGARREEIERTARDELVNKFTEAWRERKAADDWIEAKQITEVFYALRDCQATPFDGGKWDHKTCNHGRKLLESREQVRDLPQEMLQKVVAKIRDITFTEREAGKLGRSDDFLRVVGAAERAGGLATIYPNGSIWEAPCDLSNAVSIAMTVLALQKLPKDDVPPKEIWGHSEKLIEWLERVERKQGKPEEEEIEDPPEGHELVRNELVEELIGKVKKRGE